MPRIATPTVSLLLVFFQTSRRLGTLWASGVFGFPSQSHWSLCWGCWGSFKEHRLRLRDITRIKRVRIRRFWSDPVRQHKEKVLTLGSYYLGLIPFLPLLVQGHSLVSGSVHETPPTSEGRGPQFYPKFYRVWRLQTPLSAWHKALKVDPEHGLWLDPAGDGTHDLAVSGRHSTTDAVLLSLNSGTMDRFPS